MMKLDNKGFSLIEVVFSLVIITIIMGALSLSFMNYNKFMAAKEKEIVRLMDKEVAMKYLWKDVSHMSISFNNIDVQDDRGNFFFDYYPGCPSPRKFKEGLKRELVIGKGGKNKVTFITMDPEVKIPIFINPVLAYNVGDAPLDINKSGSLSFVSLDKDKQITRQNKDVWRQDKYFYLYSPVIIRTEEDGSLCDFNNLKRPKVPAYFGKMSGGRLGKVQMNGLKFNYRNAVDLTDSYDSEDDFLRKMPAMGGGSPIVILVPSRIVTYEFVQEDVEGSDEKKNVLYRILDVGGGEKPIRQVVAVGLSRVRFFREDVTTDIINVEILNEPEA